MNECCTRIHELILKLSLSVLAVMIPGGCDSGQSDPASIDDGQNLQTTTEIARESTDKLRSIASVGMVADLVRQVGGDRVEVRQIMGSGVDPHLYKATRDDVRLLMGAELIFYSGLMLEGRLTDTLIRIGNRKPVIAVTERIPQEQLLRPDGGGDHWDPHVWMDVEAWSMCVTVISDQLCLLDKASEHQFRARAEVLQAELKSLHEYGLKCINSIPRDRRVLITSHDAFSYFGRAYGLEVIGVQGLSTESEAGLRRINELVDLIVERRIAAVFVESSVPRRNILALIDGSKSRGQQVIIGGELYSDAMGADGTYEGTYIGMLDHNFTVVARALGGMAPERGFQGRLSPGSN